MDLCARETTLQMDCKMWLSNTYARNLSGEKVYPRLTIKALLVDTLHILSLMNSTMALHWDGYERHCSHEKNILPCMTSPVLIHV